MRDDIFSKLSDSAKDAIQNTDNATEAVEKYKTASEATRKATITGSLKQTLKSGAKSFLTTGLNALTSGAGFAAATALLSFAVDKISDFIHREEIAIQKGEEAKSTIDETFDSFSKGKSTITQLGSAFAENGEEITNVQDGIDSLAEGYTRLAKGVNADNSNRILSDAEYEQYLNISNQLAELYPTLVSGYDAQGNALLNLGTNAGTAADQLERLYETQRGQSFYDMSSNLQAQYDGLATEYKQVEKQIGKNQKAQEEALSKVSDYDTLTEVFKTKDGETSKAQQFIEEGLAKGLFTFDAETLGSAAEEMYSIIYDELSKARANIDPNMLTDANGNRVISFSPDSIANSEIFESLPTEVLTQLEKSKDHIQNANNETMQQTAELENRQKDFWRSMSESYKQVLQSSEAFSDLDTDLQNNIIKNLQDLNIDAIDTKYEGDAIDFLYGELIDPLSTLSADAQASLNEAFKIDPSELGFYEYGAAINEALNKAFPNDAEMAQTWKKRLGFEDTINEAEEQIDALSEKFKGHTADFKSMTGADRQMFYEIGIKDNFSGTFDELQAKVKNAQNNSKVVIDVEPSQRMDAYTSALASENAGDTYDAMMEAFDKADDLFSKHLTGTDDFQAAAALISPNGMTDAGNWAENQAQRQRYFTKDSEGNTTSDGILNFINDLQSLGYGEVEDSLNGIGKTFVANMQDMRGAANKMGISWEAFVAIWNKGIDYEATSDVLIGSVDDGVDKLTSKYAQLAEARKKYNEDLSKRANGDKSVSDEVLKQEQEAITQYESEINQVKAQLPTVSAIAAEEISTSRTAAKDALQGMIDEYKRIMDNPEMYGENTEYVGEKLREQIESMAGEWDLQLDADLNIQTTKDEMLSEANEAIEEAQNVIRQGNWEGMGTAIDFNPSDLDTVEEAYAKIRELQDLKASGNLDTTQLEQLEVLLGRCYDKYLLLTGKQQLNLEFSTNLDTIIDEAEAGSKELKELGLTANDFNFDGTQGWANEFYTIKSVIEEIKSANGGTFDIKAEGAEAALAVLNGVLAAKQQVSQPTVMHVDASALTGDAQAAISVLQQYKEKVDEISRIKQIGEITGADVTVDVSKAQSELEGLKSEIQGMKDNEVMVALGIDPESDLTAQIESLDQEVLIKAGISPESLADLDGELNVSDKEITIKANVTGKEDIEAIKQAIEALPSNTPATVDISCPNKDLIPEVNNMLQEVDLQAPDSTITVNGQVALQTATNVDEKLTEVDNNNPESDITANDYASSVISQVVFALNSLNGKSATVSINVKQNGSIPTDLGLPGGATAFGTMLSPAHANGTFMDLWNNYYSSAYANGNVAINRPQAALMNELGVESIVRDGKWMLVPGPAHMEQLKKGDIIFNARQTAELIRSGRVSSGGGRGRMAYADGTAYNTINAFADGTDAEDEAEESLSDVFSKLIDWMEYSMTNFERAIDRNISWADDVADNLFRPQNEYLNQAIYYSKIYREHLQKLQDQYMAQATSVGLSEDYALKVRIGAIDIESIEDEDLRTRIEEYQKWYEAAMDAQDKADEMLNNILELGVKKLENIVDDYDKSTGYIESLLERNDKYQEQFEGRGWTQDVSTLKGSIELTKQLQQQLWEEWTNLSLEFERLVKDGTIQEGTDEWWEWKTQLQDIHNEIIDTNISIEEMVNTIHKVRFEKFEKAIDDLDVLNDDLETLNSLISDSGLFNDDATIRDNGIVKAGLYSMQLIVARKQVQIYNNAIEALKTDLEQGVITQEQYNEALTDFKSRQNDAIKSVYEMRQAILDIVRDGIEKETEAYNELIEAKKEALSDKYEAKKRKDEVAEYQKKITLIERQIAAMQNDTTAETTAKRKQLEQELLEAKKELEDYYYEQSYNDQQEALDDQNESFQEAQEDRLDELETSYEKQNQVIEDFLKNVTENHQVVFDELKKLSEQYGIDITENILKPWQDAEDALKHWQEAIGQGGAGLTGGTWKEDEKGWRYYKNDGSLATGTQNIDGEKYQFDDQGYMQTGWQKDDSGKWNYFDKESGAAKKNQWITDDEYGRKYYVKNDGTMADNEIVEINGKKYFFQKDGPLGINKWIESGGNWYHTDASGQVLTGWYKDGWKWYYLDDDGKMLSSQWVDYKGNKYFLHKDGAMAFRTYIKETGSDVYKWVDEDGKYDPSRDTTHPDLSKYSVAYYKNGTYGAKFNQLAKLNELGDELALHANKRGDLSYITKGTSVIPSELTKQLVSAAANPKEWIMQNLGINGKTSSGQPPAPSIVFSSPLVVVQGNANEDTVGLIEDMLQKAVPEICNKEINNTMGRIMRRMK